MTAGEQQQGPVVSLPAPLNSSQAARFQAVLVDYKNVLENITTAISHATDAAVDLQEVGEHNEVARMEESIKQGVYLTKNLMDNHQYLQKVQERLLRGEEIRNLVEAVEASNDLFQEKWNESTDAEKYHDDNSYRDFRVKIWEVDNGDVPMPPLGGSGEGESDDDVVIGTQKVSLTCPLTTKLFEDPQTSTTCKHSFSKNAIVTYIQSNRGNVACPVAGCDKFLRLSSLKPNKQLARRVEKQQQQLEQDEDDDEYTAVEN